MWLDDGTHVNRELVADGLARAVLFEPNDAYWDDFRGLADTARADGRGMWGACGG